MVSAVTRRGALPVLLCTMSLVTGGGCAAKQPVRSFSDLPQRLKPGHTVFVIDATGSETKGKVVAISASELTLDVNGVRRPMDSASVRQVQRYGDSLWNGVLIGAAVGTLGVLIADPRYEACKDDPQKLCADAQTGQRVMALALMGALGAGIDALIRRRHQVYLAAGEASPSARRIAVSPRLGPSALGLFITLDVNKRTMTESDRAGFMAERVAPAASRAGHSGSAQTGPPSRSPE